MTPGATTRSNLALSSNFFPATTTQPACSFPTIQRQPPLNTHDPRFLNRTNNLPPQINLHRNTYIPSGRPRLPFHTMADQNLAAVLAALSECNASTGPRTMLTVSTNRRRTTASRGRSRCFANAARIRPTRRPGTDRNRLPATQLRAPPAHCIRIHGP